MTFWATNRYNLYQPIQNWPNWGALRGLSGGSWALLGGFWRLLSFLGVVFYALGAFLASTLQLQNTQTQLQETPGYGFGPPTDTIFTNRYKTCRFGVLFGVSWGAPGLFWGAFSGL